MTSTEMLSDEQIKNKLSSLNVAWSAIPGQGLVRVFDTADFAAGLGLLNKIGALAEKQNHHPDARLSYNQLELTVITHSAGGVTQQDIDFAAAIDSQFS